MSDNDSVPVSWNIVISIVCCESGFVISIVCL
jgi:hypothetical protein